MTPDLYFRMVETWRPVPGYEGIYSVSDHGRVRRDKGGSNTWAGRILAGGDHHGYRTVAIDPPKSSYIHRLVAAAFLGPCPDGYEVNHKNGNKADNQLHNLEYMTHAQNLRHAHKTGLSPLGSQRPFSKLTESKVREIRTLHASGVMQKDIAPRFGITKQTVCKIIKRQKWSHIA